MTYNLIESHHTGDLRQLLQNKFTLDRQKEEPLSATTLRNLQQPSDFLQGLIRGR